MSYSARKAWSLVDRQLRSHVPCCWPETQIKQTPKSLRWLLKQDVESYVIHSWATSFSNVELSLDLSRSKWALPKSGLYQLAAGFQ